MFGEHVKSKGNHALHFVYANSFILHGKEDILKHKYHSLHRPHFGKLLQSSAKENKNCNPHTTLSIFTDRRIMYHNFSVTI